jgi:uncharacterized protein DUF5130
VALGDQVTAGEQATADNEAASTPARSDAAVAEHTGESHDGARSAETVPAATSAGGAASAETEAASTHEAAQQQTDREQAEAEQGILGAAPVRHAPAAAGTSTAPAPAALIESTQIRRAITQAEKRTDLNWSVFIGTLGDNPRAQAEARHAELGPAAAKSVLIAVDPTAHRLEIVTGTHARSLLDDRSCALAAASMTSTFAVRDLDGGIAYGILAMVEHVRRAR